MTIQLRVFVQISLPKDHCDWLMALMQNKMYEDETSEEASYREHIFNRIKASRDHSGGRVRQAVPSFSITEEEALWLATLLNGPIYADEDEDEREHRIYINNEFWCPDLGSIQASLLSWDHIPF